MSDFSPIITPALTWTSTTSAAVTGGQYVEVTGDNTVGPAAAGSQKVVGQAGHDAASGATLTIHSPGRIVTEATAATVITAGQPLKTAANGQVAPLVVGTDNDILRVGIALAGAASGALCRHQSA